VLVQYCRVFATYGGGGALSFNWTRSDRFPERVFPNNSDGTRATVTVTGPSSKGVVVVGFGRRRCDDERDATTRFRRRCATRAASSSFDSSVAHESSFPPRPARRGPVTTTTTLRSVVYSYVEERALRNTTPSRGVVVYDLCDQSLLLLLLLLPPPPTAERVNYCTSVETPFLPTISFSFGTTPLHTCARAPWFTFSTGARGGRRIRPCSLYIFTY